VPWKLVARNTQNGTNTINSSISSFQGNPLDTRYIMREVFSRPANLLARWMLNIACCLQVATVLVLRLELLFEFEFLKVNFV